MIKQVAIILIIMQFALGQQTQEGTPYSQIHDFGNNNHTITLPQIEKDVLLEEDSYSPLGTPYRYGYIHKGSYSPENYGIWEKTVDGGMMWQIRFTSKDAYAISFEFEEFYVPEGSELYVFSPGYEMVQGAYTHLNNRLHQNFATPLIKGDTAIIEYY